MRARPRTAASSTSPSTTAPSSSGTSAVMGPVLGTGPITLKSRASSTAMKPVRSAVRRCLLANEAATPVLFEEGPRQRLQEPRRLHGEQPQALCNSLVPACCTNPEMALIGCPIESLTRAFGKRVAPETALCNRLVRVNLAQLYGRGTPLRRPGSLATGASSLKEHQVRRLGPNAYGELLRPGRVADCYLAILLDQPLADIAPEPGGVLVVAPAALLGEQVPQPDGQVLYDLLTGHPDRAPRDLLFLADLTAELRAWPQQRWTDLGVSPEVALLAVVDCWRAGQVKGLEVGGVGVDEARALGRPQMTYVREQLRGRLASEISRQYLRWLHPTSRRRPGESFL